MASAAFLGKEFLGWTPSIDNRREPSPGIITGTNFVDDIDGPRAAWGSEFVNFNLFNTATRIEVNELICGTQLIYGTPTGLWRINSTSQAMECILVQASGRAFWPWTVAYVGGKYYFAQYDVGLWQYDPTLETMKHIAGLPWGEKTRFLAESYGRLIVLADTVASWSSQDNGTDFTPSLTTGAGAQFLSLIGGNAFALMAVADGFVTFTDRGIMKSQFVQESYIFRHYVLTRDLKLFSPNAVITVPDVGLIALDGKGFRLVPSSTSWDNQNEATPQVWEEERSDYIVKNIFNTLDRTKIGTIAMYYSQAERKLFVSFSSNANESLMQVNYVYNVINKRWGSFDRTNYGIFETYQPSTGANRCSYMGTDGYMHAVSVNAYVEGPAESPFTMADFIYRPSMTEMQGQVFTDSASATYVIFRTEFNWSDFIPTAYRLFTTSGLYEINFDAYSDFEDDGSSDPDPDTSGAEIIFQTNIVFTISGMVLIQALPYSPPQRGLNSVVEIGHFRFPEQKQADETSALSSLIVGLAQTSSFSVVEDYMDEEGSEDWASLADQIDDWGSGSSLPNVFDLILRDTDDGTSTPIQGDETLIIAEDLGSGLQYSPMGYVSIYHRLKFSATEPGQAFAIKTIDIAGMLTGRRL